MNKGQIREQVKALLNRNDVTDSQIDSFVELALSRIQRLLRIPTMERSFEADFSASFPDSFFLPVDFLEFIDVYHSSGGKLQYKPFGQFLSIPEGAGTPKVYTRHGGRVMVKPTPPQGDKVSLLYYGEFPEFTDDLSSNWISDIAPELLIYGALSFAADHFIDDRKPVFEEVYARTIAELELQASMLEMSGAAMTIQPTYQDY